MVEEGSMLPSSPGCSHTPPDKVPQYLWTIAATLLVVSGGTAIGWTAPALPVLQANETQTDLRNQAPMHISHEVGSWVGSLLPVGALIGALPAGSVAASLGPKRVSHLLGVPMALAWLMKVFATNVWVLFIARLLAGGSLGACCATIQMYVGEIAHPSIRGSLSSCFQLMLVTGILYVYLFGAVLSYRMMNVACAVVPALFLAAFYLAPESPAYLLSKGHKTQAEESFKRLRGPDYNYSTELRSLQTSHSSGPSVSFLTAAAKRPAPRALIISLGLMCFQQLSGINIVIFYMNQIFEDANISMNASTATVLVGLGQVLATFCSVLLIEKAGRKILLLISGGVMAVCLFALGGYFKAKNSGGDVSSITLIPLAAVIIFILMFSIGFGPIPWLMAAEVLPNDIKGMGMSIAVALNWSLAFLVTKIFQDLLDLIGDTATYWLLASVCVISVPFTMLFITETKGKSYAEVQRSLCAPMSFSFS